MILKTRCWLAGYLWKNEIDQPQRQKEAFKMVVGQEEKTEENEKELVSGKMGLNYEELTLFV